MTVPEAIDLAVKVLREKAEIERIQLNMVERAPAIARQIDAHASRRFERFQEAIVKLNSLKQREMGEVGSEDEHDQA